LSFDDLKLAAPLLRALADAGYDKPTPIQQQAIVPALDGRDVLGCAQTGTGKTAAFALPILQHLDRVAGRAPRLQALVLAPTRELAAQISKSFAIYGKHLDLYHTVVFGGVNDKPQIAELRRGVDLLVATPGRLLDLMNRGHVRLDDIDVLVLDEADRMLDMGFIHDVRRITRALPERRQTLFFSATMPPPIEQLAKRLLCNPVRVAASPVATPAEKVEQSVYLTDKQSKPSLLLEVLSQPECQRALIFSRTKHGANRVAKQLAQRGIAAAAIHGNKSQGARTRALEGFRSGSLPVLVATDIAARGVDVEGITHVINYDLPNEPDTYVHRIGRTARAGATGKALSFCGPEEYAHLSSIERLIGTRIARRGENRDVAQRTGEAPAPRRRPRSFRRSGRRSRTRA
jgi:ATP-dependent RNA helicase RhlE